MMMVPARSSQRIKRGLAYADSGGFKAKRPFISLFGTLRGLCSYGCVRSAMHCTRLPTCGEVRHAYAALGLRFNPETERWAVVFTPSTIVTKLVSSLPD